MSDKKIKVSSEIINRRLCHFLRADIGLEMAIAKGIGISMEDTMTAEHSKM